MQGGLAGAGGIRRRLLVRVARKAGAKLQALVSEPQHHHEEQEQQVS